MILGEAIGVGIMLLIALYVAVKIMIEEITESIPYYRRRNHWKKRYRG